MLFVRLLRLGFLPVLFSRGQNNPEGLDPCSKVAGKRFVDPLDAEACMSSFPSNETLKQNVLSVVSGSLDFYTWEANYLNLPEPFHQASWDIRAEIRRINQTFYDSDYQFNRDLYEVVNRLYDGHTLYQPNCYLTYRFITPTPLVGLGTGIHIAPNAGTLFEGLGPNFTAFYEEKGVDWKRLAGARVLEIGGLPAWEYIDYLADKVSGSFLDHNVRTNLVFSSYMFLDSTHRQLFGDAAARNFLMESGLELSVVPVNSTSKKPEFVKVPFVASFVGQPFKDKGSYWAQNCVATNTTNGLHRGAGPSEGTSRHTRAARVHQKMALEIPHPFKPTLAAVKGNAGDIESHILPGNKTGVLYVGSFEATEESFENFQHYVHDSVETFTKSGVENILVDVTNNGGGVVCAGFFLRQYFAGTNSGFPGFQSTSRASPLAQKIVKNDIALNISGNYSMYSPENWQFVNGTQFPPNYNYNDPPIPSNINQLQQPTSQRLEDSCPLPVVTMPKTPPFDLKKLFIIGNGFCASTCSLFASIMRQKGDVGIVTFGGHPDSPIEYRGTAGHQVLSWVDLDSEIKTAGLKNDFPQEFIVNASMSINWRTAYSWLNLDTPLVFESDPSPIRFNHTNTTYNNPYNTWLFVEKKLFH